MDVDAGAPLAHRANKQYHMAEPGRAITSASAGLGGQELEFAAGSATAVPAVN